MVQYIQQVNKQDKIAEAETDGIRNERDAAEDDSGDFKAPCNFRLSLHIMVMRSHEIRRKNRIDDIRHEQGSQQSHNESNGQVHHEITDDTGPERERDKGSQYNQCTR